MVKDGGVYWCQVCDYSTPQKIQMTLHVEAKHFTLGYQCDICQIKLKTKQFLQRHKVKHHGMPSASDIWRDSSGTGFSSCTR